MLHMKELLALAILVLASVLGQGLNLFDIDTESESAIAPLTLSMKPTMTTKSAKTGITVTAKPLATKAGKGSKHHYDMNGDGLENMSDIVFVSRSLADPLHEFPIGDLSADINGDGILDLKDLSAIIAYMFTVVDPADLAPLTPTIIEDISKLIPYVYPEPSPMIRHLNQQSKTSTYELHVPRWTVLGQSQHRELLTCGLGTFGRYSRGNKNTDPTRDQGGEEYPFDRVIAYFLLPAFAVTHILYAIYMYTLPTLFYAYGWTEAALAFIHYMDNEGTPRKIDYEKAYNDDPRIKAAVDQEISDVIDAVREMHDGEENLFEFFSTKTREVVVTRHLEWQAVLGQHLIWSSGTASYNSDSCSLAVEIVIKAEDFYDFNKYDPENPLATIIPGAFSTLGYAKGYYSTGAIYRTETIYLQCCKKDDCSDPLTFECTCHLCTTQCPTTQVSGGPGFTSFTVDLLKTQGTFTVEYEHYDVPDELKIYYEGSIVFQTGLVSGSKKVDVTYGSTTSISTTVTVEVNAPAPVTEWNVSVSCAA